MKDYVEISVQPDLLPQVARDLLTMADDANHVHASTGESGPILLVHPDLAEAWFQKVANEEVEDSTEPEPTEDEVSVDKAPAPTPPSGLPVTEEPVKQPMPTAPVVANEKIDSSVVATEEVESSTISSASTVTPAPEVQLPVKRGPGRPRKVTSASPSEVL